MHIYLTEMEDRVLHHRDEDRHHRPPHPAPPRPRTRTRLAGSLRRVADRLEQ